MSTAPDSRPRTARPGALTLPPGPPRGLPGRHLLAMHRDRLGFLQRLHAYGDVAHVDLGPFRLYLVSAPHLVEDVLVTQGRRFGKGRALQRAKRLLGEGLLTSEGALHLSQRRTIQPLFHRQRLADYADAMVRHAARARERWQDGQEIDVADAMAQLTLTIVGDALFHADVEADAGEVRDALTAAIDMFNLMLLPFSELLEQLPLPRMVRLRRAIDRLDRIVYGLVAARRSRGEENGDLLSLLLSATDEGGAPMSDRQVRDETMTIVLAGHETTANALAWTWALLARHPEVERRFHEEIDRVLGCRLPTADSVPELPYTRMVLAESMRLYPPAWIVGRRALEDVKVGGFDVPGGSIVIVSQWLVHRDARFHEQPERFDPDRWNPERAHGRPRFSYFPFGGGHRVCIGEHFAWTEGILVLATLAQRWSIRLRHDGWPGLEPLITLRPKGGLRMIPHERRTRG